MRKASVNICRLLLAATFILSGFVKAVDPAGTQYKIADYAEAFGLAGYFPEFVFISAAVLLSAMEFTIGIALLFAIRRRLTSRIVAAVMAVFTPFTLWIALADPVSDCGCFGDAVSLTNWQTFWKNVVLLYAAVTVCRRPEDIVRLISKSSQWIVINYTVVFILAVSGYSLYYLPPFDFRPYHVGADIRKGMEMPPGKKGPQFETTFTMEKDGTRKEFTIDNYPDSTWTFIDSKTVMTDEGYVPPIHDFSIVTRGTDEDITDEVLDDKGYTFLLVAPHIEKADDSRLDQINLMYEYALEHGHRFYCLTASPDKAIERWRDITGAEYPFCTTDETTLKTVIRSNPGLVMLKAGVVMAKWSNNNLPEEEELERSTAAELAAAAGSSSTTGKVLYIIMWYVLPLFVLTLADRLWAWTQWVKRKKDSNIIYKLFKRKKMRKKIVAMMMAAALVVSTAACGSSGGDTKGEANTGSEAAATSEVANKDKPLVWFNRQPSNSSTGELDKTALNFNKDTYYVGFDANQGAEVQGQMVKEYIEKNIDKVDRNGDGVIGYVLAIGDIGHNDSIARTRGVRKALGTGVEKGGELNSAPTGTNTDGKAAEVKDGEVEVNGKKYVIRELASQEMKNSAGATWDAATAGNAIGTWASSFGDSIDLVVSNNDGMGMSMFNAWSKDNKVPTFGYDANSDAVAAIAEGYGGTVSQHADVQAYLTLRVLRNALDGVDVDTGIGTADEAGNVLSKDVYKYSEEERSYYALNAAVTADNYKDFTDSTVVWKPVSNQLDSSKHATKKVWLNIYNASDNFLSSTYQPLLQNYDDLLNLDVEYIGGDGQTESNVTNRLGNPSQYDAFAINMVKTDNAASYTAILNQ